ncbi:MAG: cytochrome c [Sediminibacterium sp.]|jgi:mono/diheme cytochrome c family protein|uniref:c-type cytochrome n=1 Tax=Sediminibacterium sp. TaxID=1917865 RepID=UPI002ABBC8E6|nr:cytochrome c [Sediminibacterium sp.]MDZ4070671.1 cytochrome c [Sediminibacterium sp.]
MKKLLIIALAATATTIVACSDVKRTPGTIYMPDMAYSRAYESYADYSNLTEKGIHYTAMPVEGTLPRGAELPFHIAKDVPGDTTNYFASRAVPNPIDSMTEAETIEAERLYQINCGICHGTKLDGNGPLWKDGNGPYTAAPKNLIADPLVSVMPDGQMFYSLTYGKNLMGSYASQLNRKQRWMVIKYIKIKQKEAKATAATTTAAK